jgi:tryptophan synthase alpha chain
VTGPARLGGLSSAFETAKRERRGAFLPFLTSGYPDLVESDRLAAALCDEGADVLELGVPFSDPIADGPVIQRTTETALRAGATLAHALGQTMRLHARYDTPIVLMTYLNPVLRYGTRSFITDAVSAGVDGVILVDLPPEEEEPLWEGLRDAGIDTVTLVAPTTDPARLARIARRASGFLYVVARLGVTGQGPSDAVLDSILDRCRALSPLPRCLGFGMDLTTPIGRYRGKAEGIVVGSALLQTLLESPDARAREARARRFAQSMRAKLAELAPS